MPEISVIIPVRNSASTLTRCLESVISQTYSDWEALCVYDDSDDNSLAIIKEYCEKDSRFVLVRGRGVNLSCARNDGMKSASGKYILFLDSDDAFLPNAFLRIRAEFEKRGCDIIVFGTKLEPNTPRVDCRLQLSMSTPNKFYRSFSAKALFGEPSARPFVWRNAFRREFIEKNSLYFDEGCKVGEDHVFQLCAFPFAENGILFIKESLYRYTWSRKGSLMDTYNRNSVFKLKGHIKMVDSVFLYWEKREFSRISKKDISVWALYFLTEEIPYLANEKLCALSGDLDELFHAHIDDRTLRSLPRVTRKKALKLQSHRTYTKNRFIIFSGQMWWCWHFGGAGIAMRLLFARTRRCIENRTAFLEGACQK